MKLCICISLVFLILVHDCLLESATAVLLADELKLMPKLKVTTTSNVKWMDKPKPNKKESQADAELSHTYYLKSCPNVEGIIQRKVNAWVKRDPTLAASIIRLHFHDCAVRGCDGSILLDHKGSERRALASMNLRGFDLIDEIKTEVEKKCGPKVVSCADILTAASRDATVYVGGPFWEIPFGRKDGKISISKEANAQVPQGHENITALIHFFQVRGLTPLDLVILSGAHTIGRTGCFSIRPRLNLTAAPINPRYLHSVRKQCRKKWYSTNNFVNLDGTTSRIFDEVYYKNLQKKMGLLLTDQRLYSDERTAPIVDALASQSELFFNQFAVSMIKLGNVQVLTGKGQGEVRANCNHINSKFNRKTEKLTRNSR